jgi:hypothetical protein
MKYYDLKLLGNTEASRNQDEASKSRASESELKDLLTVLPTLKKHKVESQILTRVRTLRSGRTQKGFTLELSRLVPELGLKIETKENDKGEVISRKTTQPKLTVTSPISRKVLDTKSGKVELLRSLKNQLIKQIQDARKASLPPIENFSYREGVVVKKLAEVYLEKETFLKLTQKRIRLNMRNGKIPTSKDNHIGVEIEFAAKQNIEQVCDALHEAGLGKHIHAKRDGSISQPAGYPNQVEIAIIAKQSEIKKIIERTCDVLNNKLNVKIDKTCGLHVHLDMRTRKVEQCYANLILMQRYLYAMVPANRKNASRREGTRVVEGFSAPIESPKWTVPREHYWGINSLTYDRFQTLEIRMHCGTLQAKKINNWVSFLVAIVEAKALTAIPDDMDAVQEAIGITKTLKEYIDARIAKFAPQHKKNPNPKWMGDAKVTGKADNTDPEDSEVA